MHTDPIADMLTRIRNAKQARKQFVSMPSSRIKRQILDVLIATKFVKSVREEKDGAFATLIVEIAGNNPLTLTRVSKPGLRIYKKADELKSVKNGLGIAVLSTSQGIMTNKEAHAKGIGGELLCEVY